MYPTRTQALAVFVALNLPVGIAAQAVFVVSPAVDNASAPAAGSLAGLGFAARQQILIDEWRLAGLRNRKLLGIVFRRDLGDRGALRGGAVDLEVRLAAAVSGAAKTSEQFGVNRPAPTVVFANTVAVPDSPEVGATTQPWDPRNTIRIDFSTPYPYAGGTLCIELVGRPVKGKEPVRWNVDHELAEAGGAVREFGTSCSPFAAHGSSLNAETTGLTIGSSLRLVGFGRTGSSPLLLIGARAIPGGVDLTPMGAPGCSQLVDAMAAQPLLYYPPRVEKAAAFFNFRAQVPADGSLLAARVYFQSVDIETGLPKPWSNPAGLTTSNAVELHLASTHPVLGMAVVRATMPTASEPATGSVDVEAAPVMRVLY
ncbi:MAG: hypothetical protein H6837_20635 [Planctomycetes bacterium]|nr:hypothetical protein [Planctomycetota bacterium]